MPICLEVALRSDCRACFSVSALRRASSQARTSSTSFHASPLRGFSRAFTSSGFSRITRMSSITRTACTPSPRHASQMNGLPWKNVTLSRKNAARRGMLSRMPPLSGNCRFSVSDNEFFSFPGKPYSRGIGLSMFPGIMDIRRQGALQEGPGRKFLPFSTGGVPFITICS